MCLGDNRLGVVLDDGTLFLFLLDELIEHAIVETVLVSLLLTGEDVLNFDFAKLFAVIG